MFIYALAISIWGFLAIKMWQVDRSIALVMVITMVLGGFAANYLGE